MLNKYLERLDRLIAEYQNQELAQFHGPTGKAAQWDDLIWYHIEPNTGRKTRFLCGKHGIKGSGNAGNKPEFALPLRYGRLIKIWIIEINTTSRSASSKQTCTSDARYLLSHMQGELFSQTKESISLLRPRSFISLNPFLKFCSENGLMRPCSISNSYSRDRTGHAQFDSHVEKLPEIEAILALGAMHHETFQSVSQSGSLRVTEQINIMNAVVTTSGLLGLASPNRIAAETVLAPNQQLKMHTESGGKPVHYLDWVGSKGFKDNRNHVLSALANEVDRAVNFFFNACEPARILCRFYESPKQSLRKLLGTFKVEKDRQKHLQFDQTPNLFVLGYALGFYPVDACVPTILPSVIPPNLKHNNPKYRACFQQTHIYSLRHEDRLATSCDQVKIASIPQLFGYINNTKMASQALGCVSKHIITVGELQDNWIRYFGEYLIPSFPFSYSSGEGKIKLSDALFCVQGYQLHGRSKAKGSAGKLLAKSPYAIVPLSSIASHIIARFTGSAIGTKSIFEEFGFAGFSLKLHSLRHFGNTLAELSEIPHEIITAWSGRKNKEHTDTYLHRRHQEQADRVRAVLSKSQHDKREIKVVAQEAISHATNLPASITSTGLCTQELNVTPCEYLNDFISQCFMCSAACHVARDTQAIQLLEKDYKVQAARLELVSKDQRLPNSIAMQRWFILHSRNIHVLATLIDLMRTLPQGSVIRYSPRLNEFHVTDENINETSNTPCLIPDFENALHALLDDQGTEKASKRNPELRSLLSSFGLSEEVI